jgi:hypothetical protein
MNGSVAKALRKMAYNEWEVMHEELKAVITTRMIYQELKKDYMKERKYGA